MIGILIIQLLLVPLLSPLWVGVIRKIKAMLQNRRGAGIFQPYKDLWKLLHKDEVISKDASWVFTIAPYVVFSVTVFVASSIPLLTSSINNAFSSNLLVLVYLLSLGTFFLALAGIDVGSGFGGLGSSREVTLAALAESGFIFSLLTMALIAGTMNVFAISGHLISFNVYHLLSVALAFFAFFIVLLAETARFPFDNPATHLELTMIHEAMILEYSGKKLALMEWASANKLFIFMILAANIFFPFGMAQDVSVGALLTSAIVLVAKMIIFCAVIALIESTIAKLRFFRLPDLLIVSFILNMVAILLIYQF